MDDLKESIWGGSGKSENACEGVPLSSLVGAMEDDIGSWRGWLMKCEIRSRRRGAR